jgi:predicted enzyme related to lactoylglutathione lyase
MLRATFTNKRARWLGFAWALLVIVISATPVTGSELDPAAGTASGGAGPPDAESVDPLDGPTAVAPEEETMERVQGIGGLFFRSRDPAALAAWYETHLGVTRTPTTYEETPWFQDAGPTVWGPFPADTDYFGRPEQGWMVNFRVRDLDAMVRQLQAAGIEVKVDPETYPNGRFARLHDPEGNPIELWQPEDLGSEPTE